MESNGDGERRADSEDLPIGSYGSETQAQTEAAAAKRDGGSWQASSSTYVRGRVVKMLGGRRRGPRDIAAIPISEWPSFRPARLVGKPSLSPADPGASRSCRGQCGRRRACGPHGRGGSRAAANRWTTRVGPRRRVRSAPRRERGPAAQGRQLEHENGHWRAERLAGRLSTAVEEAVTQHSTTSSACFASRARRADAMRAVATGARCLSSRICWA